MTVHFRLKENIWWFGMLSNIKVLFWSDILLINCQYDFDLRIRIEMKTKSLGVYIAIYADDAGMMMLLLEIGHSVIRKMPWI